MKMTLEEAESKLTAIAKLPKKWRKNRAEPWELIQDLEAALGSLPMEPVPKVPADPLPAGKLSDEQLGAIGLRAANSCNHQVKFYENFARAVREAVEKECNRSMQNGLYQAIVNKLKPILGENSRELEWDILPFTLGKLIAAKRIPDAGQAKKIGEQAEEIARLTAKSEEMCQAFVAEAAKKHEALAIIEQAIEMVNTLGTTKDNLPKAINAKIMQRDEFHDATLKKLDAAKEDIARLLKLDATNRENCDRTHKALVESQLLQLETQKALAKANAELERMQWRPVSVKPTRDDADEGGGEVKTQLTLQEIHEKMQSQVYGPHVTMQECYSRDFMTWFLHFQDTLVHPGSPPDMQLHGFDIESAVSIMAEWIKAPFSDSALP